MENFIIVIYEIHIMVADGFMKVTGDQVENRLNCNILIFLI